MAWIYLAASEDSPLLWNHGLGQSPTVKTIDTAKVFYCPECMWVQLQPRQSGMTCGHSTASYSKTLISSTGGFLARISLAREMVLAWRESEASYFLKSQDWLGSFDPPSYSWKTCQQSLFEDSIESSWSSLRYGTTVGGRLYQPTKLEPRILENDGGYLPTPTAELSGRTLDQFEAYQKKHRGGRTKPCHLEHWVQLFPTPTARDSRSFKGAAARPNRQGGKNLIQTVGGQLNPTWVEWLMGYPTGWTVLEAWATQWFRSKRERRLKD